MVSSNTFPVGSDSPAAEARVLAALAMVGLVVSAIYLLAEWRLLGSLSGFPLDDTWIHLEFARNLAAGAGLSFEPPRMVAGSTAPLWTALLAILEPLPGAPALWLKLVGVVLYLGGIRATYRLARELDLGVRQAGFAGLMTAITGWLAWAALSGLEISLFILLSLWGIILHLRERRRAGSPPLSLLVMAVAALARPEGLLLLVAAVIDRLGRWSRGTSGELGLAKPELRPVLAGLGVALVILVPVALFNLAVSGSPLPTTFAVKASGGHHWLPDLRSLFTILSLLFRPQPWLLLLSAAGVVALVERLGGPRDAGLLPGLWLMGLPLAFATLNTAQGEVVVGNFGRYLFPLFPLIAVLGTLGLARAADNLGSRLRIGSVELPLRLALAALILVPTMMSTARVAGRYAQSVANVTDSDLAMAAWLAENVSPAAKLAANDIGALKYQLPNRVVDLAGIVDPEVIEYRREATRQGQPAHAGTLRFLGEQRPDYLIVFPRWFPALVRDSERFPVIHRLTIPHNITMGDHQLVVLETPWTRYPRRPAVDAPGSGNTFSRGSGSAAQGPIDPGPTVPGFGIPGA